MPGVLDVWRARGTGRVTVVGDQFAVDGQLVPKRRGFGAGVLGGIARSTIPLAATGMAYAGVTGASNGGTNMRRSFNFDPGSIVSGGGSNGGRGGRGIVDVLIGAIPGLIGGGSSEPPQGSAPVPGLVAAGPCPSGQVSVAGKCVNLPFHGAPGAGIGAVGTPAHQHYGEAVVGSFGVPALQPAQVAQPTLRCPRGAVLGLDDLCYQKGSIPRQFRKWKPTPKPVVSAYDARMMRKFGPGGSKQARVKKLAQEAGFKCAKK